MHDVEGRADLSISLPCRFGRDVRQPRDIRGTAIQSISAHGVRDKRWPGTKSSPICGRLRAALSIWPRTSRSFPLKLCVPAHTNATQVAGEVLGDGI